MNNTNRCILVSKPTVVSSVVSWSVGIKLLVTEVVAEDGTAKSVPQSHVIVIFAMKKFKSTSLCITYIMLNCTKYLPTIKFLLLPSIL